MFSCSAGGPGRDGSVGGVRGRKLDDEQRRRLERQEATALKMRVSEDRIKTAIIAAKWPIPVRVKCYVPVMSHWSQEAVKVDLYVGLAVPLMKCTDRCDC